MFNNQIIKCLAILFLSSVFVSCKKTDIENKILTVSRLYISTANADTSAANLTVFDPADANPLSNPYSFQSKMPQASGILFDPFSGIVFQASNSDSIKLFTVDKYGKLRKKSSFVDSSLVSSRDIAFDRFNDLLYVSSNTSKTIYVYKSPTNLNGTNVKPLKKFTISGQPWGIQISDTMLLVVIEDLNKGEVQLYANVANLDSGTVLPDNKIIIAGAKRLHGMTYSSKQDLLIITDIGEEDNLTDGSIYIIEGAKAKLMSNATVLPNRIISGVNTSLGDPVDIAYDEREDKGLIYVSEKANKKILVFRLADSGNVSPFIEQTLTSSPEAIYLDAR